MGLGDFVTGLFGSKNKFHADAAKVDSNAYQYGGAPGGADEAARRYQQQAAAAQGRGPAQSMRTATDFRQANNWQAQDQASRAGQGRVAGLMEARANGSTPSIASMQGAQDMQRVQAAQAAQAASARGAAGVALAQQGAANNIANAQGQISGQTQVNAANERMQAEQGAEGAYSTMRGGDAASQGAAQSQAEFGAQLGQQNNQFNANLAQTNRAQNDQFTQGMTQNEMGVRNAQLTSQENQQAQQSANTNAAQGINAGIAGQNAQMNQENSMGLIKTGASIAGAAAMSDKRAKMDVRPMSPSASPAGWLSDYMASHAPAREHDDGIPAEREERVASTWGTGQGASPAEFRDRLETYEAGRARPPTAGGVAVPGFSPGMKMSGAQPLIQQDEERVSLARAKANEGVDVGDEEQRLAGAAAGRLGAERKSARTADTMKAAAGPSTREKTGSALAQFGASGGHYDTSYHGPGAYVPPQLLAVSDASAKVGAEDMEAGGGSGASSLSKFGGSDDKKPPGYQPAGGYTPPQMLQPSDKRSKEGVRDLGEVEDWDRDRPAPSMSDAIAAKQREGRREPTSFTRDTPAAQRAVKNAELAKMSRRADEMQAGWRQSLARGASVVRDEGELDNEPSKGPADWLVDYMDRQGPKRVASAAPPGMMISDANAKAASWDEGWESARQDADRFHKMGPAELKTAAEKDAMARTVLAGRSSAWGEGQRAQFEAKAPPPAAAEYPPAGLPGTPKPFVRQGLATAERIDPTHHGEPYVPDAADRARASADREFRARVDSGESPFERPSTLHTPAPTPEELRARQFEAPRQTEGARAAAAAEAAAPPPPAEPWWKRAGSYVGGMLSDEHTKQGARPMQTPLADAARAMRGFEYEYKPGFTPPEQRQGEENVGPMAQNMARDPVAGTIVKKAPGGLLMLDTNKMVKTLGAIVADQQRQHDDEQHEIAVLASRRGRR